jgi:hypothetical protein
MTKLELETRNQDNLTPTAGPVMMTPPISEDYWAYRVRVADGQAIVAFPKFGVIGIGFAVEEDWNTNLPSDSSAEEIYDHIEHNRGDESITRETCIEAIRMIQDAIAADQAPAAHRFTVEDVLDFLTAPDGDWDDELDAWVNVKVDGATAVMTFNPTLGDDRKMPDADLRESFRVTVQRIEGGA